MLKKKAINLVTIVNANASEKCKWKRAVKVSHSTTRDPLFLYTLGPLLHDPTSWIFEFSKGETKVSLYTKSECVVFFSLFSTFYSGTPLNGHP